MKTILITISLLLIGMMGMGQTLEQEWYQSDESFAKEVLLTVGLKDFENVRITIKNHDPDNIILMLRFDGVLTHRVKDLVRSEYFKKEANIASQYINIDAYFYDNRSVNRIDIVSCNRGQSKYKPTRHTMISNGGFYSASLYLDRDDYHRYKDMKPFVKILTNETGKHSGSLEKTYRSTLTVGDMLEIKRIDPNQHSFKLYN